MHHLSKTTVIEFIFSTNNTFRSPNKIVDCTYNLKITSEETDGEMMYLLIREMNRCFYSVLVMQIAGVVCMAAISRHLHRLRRDKPKAMYSKR